MMKRKAAKRRIPPGWRISFFAGIALAAALILGGICRGRLESRDLLLLGVLGATIGAVQGPVFDPDAFRFPALWQGGFGATGAVAIILLLQLSPEAIVLGATAGFFLALSGVHLLRILDHL